MVVISVDACVLRFTWGWYNTGSCCFGLMRVWFKLPFVVCRWWCLVGYVVLGWFWLVVLVFANTSVCCGHVVWECGWCVV